jgi:hypothetical protein
MGQVRTHQIWPLGLWSLGHSQIFVDSSGNQSIRVSRWHREILAQHSIRLFIIQLIYYLLLKTYRSHLNGFEYFNMKIIINK